MHAALSATIWAAYERVGAIPPKELTVEMSEYNLHIQDVGGRVLLCLIGPKELGEMQESGSERSAGTGRETMGGGVKIAGGALGVLKMQAAALGGYLERELEGFELPEGL